MLGEQSAINNGERRTHPLDYKGLNIKQRYNVPKQVLYSGIFALDTRFHQSSELRALSFKAFLATFFTYFCISGNLVNSGD
ncbi:MAG: hypothetical protein COB04_09575 [Gammaproteobacteria bacterium]|nr:MAG: hypothetical protein COB04_09575 [Gammaproteobacteria bacterium]